MVASGTNAVAVRCCVRLQPGISHAGLELPADLPHLLRRDPVGTAEDHRVGVDVVEPRHGIGESRDHGDAGHELRAGAALGDRADDPESHGGHAVDLLGHMTQLGALAHQQGPLHEGALLALAMQPAAPRPAPQQQQAEAERKGDQQVAARDRDLERERDDREGAEGAERRGADALVLGGSLADHLVIARGDDAEHRHPGDRDHRGDDRIAERDELAGQRRVGVAEAQDHGGEDGDDHDQRIGDAQAQRIGPAPVMPVAGLRRASRAHRLRAARACVRRSRIRAWSTTMPRTARLDVRLCSVVHHGWSTSPKALPLRKEAKQCCWRAPGTPAIILYGMPGETCRRQRIHRDHNRAVIGRAVRSCGGSDGISGRY